MGSKTDVQAKVDRETVSEIALIGQLVARNKEQVILILVIKMYTTNLEELTFHNYEHSKVI